MTKFLTINKLTRTNGKFYIQYVGANGWLGDLSTAHISSTLETAQQLPNEAINEKMAGPRYVVEISDNLAERIRSAQAILSLPSRSRKPGQEDDANDDLETANEEVVSIVRNQ